MRISVSRADESHLDWIVGQLKQFSQFYGTKRSLYENEDFARGGMLAMMGQHLVLVAVDEGVGPVGFIAGVFTPHMMNPSIRVLAETFWWVAEEHRGSRAGLLLLNEFIAFGKENADWILFALETHSPVREDVLVRRGFHLQERNYLYEVDHSEVG